MSSMRKEGSKHVAGEGGASDVEEDFDCVRYRELLCEFVPRPINSFHDFELAHKKLMALSSKPRRREEQELASVLIILCSAFEEVNQRYSPQRNLRRFIERLNLKQVQVANETGIPESMISAMLSGRRQISKDCAVKLAKYFGVSVQQFISAS